MKRLVNIEYSPIFVPTETGLAVVAHVDLALGETSGHYTPERVSFLIAASDLKRLLEQIASEVEQDIADFEKPITAAYIKALADSDRDEESDDTDDDSLAVDRCNS
jgi:hypothetical protein